MSFAEIEEKVIEWGKDRSIFERSDISKQLRKLDEEFIELVEACALYRFSNGSEHQVADAIGDMIVVLTMISHMMGFSLTHCYNVAYKEISDRKGKIVDGIFVKEKE